MTEHTARYYWLVRRLGPRGPAGRYNRIPPGRLEEALTYLNERGEQWELAGYQRADLRLVKPRPEPRT